jgi:outer membrane autotransporter protein
VLPPGIFPIIGPEIATYGVVQPIARQLGMTTLGTLHERTGDTSLAATTGTPCLTDGNTPDGMPRKAPMKAPADCLNPGWGPSVWGRVLGQQIDNHYRAFADPRASGQLLGFQSGIDLWRGEWIPGHRDAAGIYVGYANANVDVNGLVTNEAATNYVLRHTGGLNLDAWSGAAYWTHYGPGDWYLDAVAQATHYEGAASTQFARLATTGFGFLSSLETGYPIHLPVFGPGFVLEPQAQIVWQRVSFDDANDGLGVVGLGTTSGASGRIGLRGKWTIVSDSGQVWQPYVRANLWRDWGAQATAVYSGVDLVPLLEQATRLQLGGGLSVRVNTNVSVYANADYQFAVGDTDGGKRDGVRGAAGVRYTW